MDDGEGDITTEYSAALASDAFRQRSDTEETPAMAATPRAMQAMKT